MTIKYFSDVTNFQIIRTTIPYYRILQKCFLPAKQFPENMIPGTIVKCTTFPSKITYISYAYPKEIGLNQDFCIIDQSISNNSKKNYQTKEIISRIEIFDSKVVNALEISVVVTITGNILNCTKFTRDTLKIIIKHLLQPYILEAGFNVTFNDKTTRIQGIENIYISKSSEKNIFSVDFNTNVSIDDVFSSNLKLRDTKPFPGLEKPWNELISVYKQNTNSLIQKNEFKLPNSLIIGPVGSGKTTLCHHFLQENNFNIFCINSSEIFCQHPGETEEKLYSAFNNAFVFVENLIPKNRTVVLIEDIDLLCPGNKTTTTESAHLNRISSQFMSLVDDSQKFNQKLILLGTTSKIEQVDKAISRNGRFINEIIIYPPNEEERFRIVQEKLKEICCNFDYDTVKLSKYIAKRTNGFSLSDIEIVFQKVQRFLQKNFTKHFDRNNLQDTFENVLKIVATKSQQGSDVKLYRCEQKFDSIGGMNSVKRSLEISVLISIKRPDLLASFGIQPMKGVLLYGPPGCCKTTIAKCLAAEANMSIICTSGAEVYSPYIGKAEKFITKIFDTARRNSPCLIFFDEIDALVGNRKKSTNNEVQTRVLSTLLLEMDGIGRRVQQADIQKNDCHILVVAATNKPNMVDEALLRPGRFDKLIHINSPTYEDRIEILKLCKNNMPLASDVNLKEIANITKSYSGADLCNLCNEAALIALSKNFDCKEITADDFNKAFKQCKSSLSEEQIKWFFNFEETLGKIS